MKTSPLTASDLQPLVDQLPAEERVRLAYYALRIVHGLRSHRDPALATKAPAGLPAMAEFRAQLRGVAHAGNSVVEAREEERS